MHVVVGASGGIGGALVRELARRGHRVRAVNRAGDAAVPAGVERLAADVATPDGAKAAAAGAAVVYHCAQPPYTDWPAAFPPLTEAIAEGATAAGAKLVLADNLYLYGPHDGPLTEDLPAAATGPKGRTRARMAERLLDLHRQGRLRVSIGRASNYYGPWRPGQRHRRAPVPRRRGRPDGALGGPPRPAPHPQLPGGRGRRPGHPW
jgi:nucleoside-diphosphate-sugar epimerase